MNKILMSLCAVPLAAVAFAETIDDYAVDEDRTIDVPSGTTTRIEYLSGSAAATLTKTGGGTLEVALIGNTNAAIRVEEGAFKSGTLGAFRKFDHPFFHLDASDASTLTIVTENGTNFVKTAADADGGSVTANKHSSRPRPYLRQNGLNGKTVLDFGSYYRNPHLGYGAALTLSEQTLVREQFYVWKDYEGTKDLALINDKEFLGPNPVNMRYSYRGYGGGGTGFKMLYTAAGSLSGNLMLDGVKASMDKIPDDGWHRVSWHGTFANTKVSDYGMYGFGYCASGDAGYGGVVVAEVVSYTNELTDAQRTYVDRYLTQKWFGSLKVAKVIVLSGATLDTSVEKLRVRELDMREGSTIVGEGLCFDDGLWKMPGRTVSGTYAVADRGTSLTPDLSFAGDAELSVAAGTGLVDTVVSATGVIRKSGDGALKLAFPGTGSLVVDAGELIVDPLATPSAYVHADATRPDTMTFGEQNGKTVITQWRDASGNGRYFAQSTEAFAYGTGGRSGKKPYPYLTENFTNGLPVVDFGAFSDYGHQDGWGAEMGLNPKMGKKTGETYDDDNPPLWNLIAVWGDHDEAKDLPLYNESRFLGPCLIGNGGAWYRGYGGGGEAFSSRNYGSTNMGNDNWVDGQFIPYESWMSTYKPPARLFVQSTFVPDSQISVQEIGGNATETTPAYKEALSTARGVSGGLQIGEVFLYRRPISTDVRRRIDNVLGAKWFGRTNPCEFKAVSVAAGAYATFPYADVIVTNLTASGTVSARSLTVADGGRLIVTAADGAFPCMTADAVSFAGTGTLQVASTDVDNPFAGPVRVIAAANGPATAQKVSGWRGVDATTGAKLVLVRHADGYYLELAPGLILLVR